MFNVQWKMTKTETYTFTVEPFHVDFSGHIFLGVLGNHLLNAAGHHSHNRGWGIDHLNENHLTCVLSRLCIEMEKMPAQYERVEVETWVESVMKLFTERNFVIRRASDGYIYGYARSVWAMIDTSTRRPANLLTLNDGDILRYIIPAEEKPCPIAGHGRLLRLEAEMADVETYHVATHYSDVDINGHINSVKYIEHILDTVPHDLIDRGIRRFEIAYKAESYLGDTLTILMRANHPSTSSGQEEWEYDIRRNEGETVVLAKLTLA